MSVQIISFASLPRNALLQKWKYLLCDCHDAECSALCGVEACFHTCALSGPKPLIHFDLPLWGICHSIFWMRRQAQLLGHVLPLVIFVSALCSAERNDMPCIVPGVMPNPSFKLFLMQEPLALMLTFQKIQISCCYPSKLQGLWSLLWHWGWCWVLPLKGGVSSEGTPCRGGEELWGYCCSVGVWFWLG